MAHIEFGTGDRSPFVGRQAWLAILIIATLAASSAQAGFFMGIGTASNYAVLQFNENAPYSTSPSASQTQFSISGGSTIVNGPLGAAAYTKVNFSGNPPAGPLYQSTVGTTSGNSYNGITPIQSSVVNATLDQAVKDAINGSTSAAALAATQTISTAITGGETITGYGGLNVIDLTKGINMTGSSGITISGNANAMFVINVDSKFVSNNGTSVTLTGGVTANHILWNYLGTSAAAFTGGGLTQTWEGTILSVDAQIQAHDRTFDGALISGQNISITSNPVLNYQPLTAVPAPPSIVAFSLGTLCMGSVLARFRSRKSSEG